jgi:hypothetical protein
MQDLAGDAGLARVRRDRRAVRSSIMFSNHQSRVFVPKASSTAPAMGERPRFSVRAKPSRRPPDR